MGDHARSLWKQVLHHPLPALATTTERVRLVVPDIAHEDAHVCLHSRRETLADPPARAHGSRVVPVLDGCGIPRPSLPSWNPALRDHSTRGVGHSETLYESVCGGAHGGTRPCTYRARGPAQRCGYASGTTYASTPSGPSLLDHRERARTARRSRYRGGWWRIGVRPSEVRRHSVSPPGWDPSRSRPLVLGKRKQRRRARAPISKELAASRLRPSSSPILRDAAELP